MKFAEITFAVAALINGTDAWSGPAHLLTARVAYEVLKSRSPDKIDQVEAILKPLRNPGECPDNVELLIVEDKHPFVECATFADNIKYHGGGFQATWHFRDRPYLDHGGKLSDFTYKNAPRDIIGAVNGIRNWFNQTPAATDNFYVQQIEAHQLCAKTDVNALSTAMRFLIHLVGDIHQPLHMAALVDERFPSGDKGGNAYLLQSHYASPELHAVWDHVVYEFHKTLHVPLADTDWDIQGQIAARIMGTYPEAQVANVRSLDPEVWAQESLQLAETVAYAGLGPSAKTTVLSDAYIKAGVPAAEKRIVTGGYRLANLLDSMDLTATLAAMGLSPGGGACSLDGYTGRVTASGAPDMRTSAGKAWAARCQDLVVMLLL